jgi:hypothetical protein
LPVTNKAYRLLPLIGLTHQIPTFKKALKDCNPVDEILNLPIAFIVVLFFFIEGTKVRGCGLAITCYYQP